MKKFRDMTDSEKLEIINAMIAGDQVQVVCIDNKWRAMIQPESISFDNCYRIPKRQMSIDWSVLKDEYICAAMDENGSAHAYKERPALRTFDWGDIETLEVKIDHLKSYDPGTVKWNESLIWRPGYGDNK